MIENNQLAAMNSEIPATSSAASSQNNIKFNLISEIKSIRPGTKRNFVCGVELELESNQAEDRQPVDIVCLIDNSGSMYGNKAALVRKSLKFLLKILGKDDQVSLISFSSYAKILCPFVKNNDENKQQLKQAIKKIRGTDGTILMPGFVEALNLLQKRELKREQTFVLLLTDGEFDEGNRIHQKMKEAVTKYELERQFYIYTFGYGDGVDPVNLQEIAKRYEGKYCLISDVQSVTDWFLLTVSGLLKCACKEVTVKINETRKDLVLINQTIGGDMIWKSQDKETRDFQIQIPLLFNGDKKCFVFECTFDGQFEVEDANRFQTVLEAQLTYSQVKPDGSKTSQIITSALTMEFLKDNQIKEEEGGENMEIEQKNEFVLNSNESYYENLMVTFFRGLGGKVINESSEIIQSKRDFSEAKIKLRNFKDNMLTNCKFLENKGIKHLLEDIEDAIEKCHPQKYYRGHFNKMNAVHERRSRSRSHDEDWNEDNQNTIRDYRGGQIALSSDSESDDDSDRRGNRRQRSISPRRRSISPKRRSISPRRRSRTPITRRGRRRSYSRSISEDDSRMSRSYSRSRSSSSSESDSSESSNGNNQRSNRFRNNNRSDSRVSNNPRGRNNNVVKLNRSSSRSVSASRKGPNNRRNNNYSNRNNNSQRRYRSSNRRDSRSRSPSDSPQYPQRRNDFNRDRDRDRSRVTDRKY